MSLKHIRKKIDQLDGEILNLIHQRMILGLKAKPFKRRIIDTAREQEVLDNLSKRMAAYPLFTKEFVVRLFKEILKESRRIQRKSSDRKNKEVLP